MSTVIHKDAIATGEFLCGRSVSLRLVTEADCGVQYLTWLEDPEVNRYLETRWNVQSLESIREFVRHMLASDHSYLFAIVENASEAHIGNIKVGPVNPRHSFADVSYFIGARECWGKGYATEAIFLATEFGFKRLGLHRLRAGVYAENVGSSRALTKVGYRQEATLVRELRSGENWDDHLLFGLLVEDWKGSQSMGSHQ